MLHSWVGSKNRLVWKDLPRTNDLAYFEKSELTAVKSFITLAPARPNLIYPCFKINIGKAQTLIYSNDILLLTLYVSELCEKLTNEEGRHYKTFYNCIIKQVALNKSSLLLKIILQNPQTLQLN
jgi:hypothetical protein